jgi:hypothetical protein
MLHTSKLVQASQNFKSLLSTIIGEDNEHIQCYDTHMLPPNDEEPEPILETITPPPPEKVPYDNTTKQTPEGATLADFHNLPDAPNIIKRDDLELENSRDELYQ